MTASNGPSPSSVPNSEPVAAEPSMDDILASIRRIIADDDALPLSRSARAAAAPQARRRKRRRLKRSHRPSRRRLRPRLPMLFWVLASGFSAAATRLRRRTVPRCPRSGRRARAASAHPYEAPKAPALKLRDFAPSEPPAHSSSPDKLGRGPKAPGPSGAAKGAESVKSAEPVARITLPAHTRPAAPSQPAPVAAKAEPAPAPEPQVLEPKGSEPKVLEPKAVEPKAIEPANGRDA